MRRAGQTVTSLTPNRWTTGWLAGLPMLALFASTGAVAACGDGTGPSGAEGTDEPDGGADAGDSPSFPTRAAIGDAAPAATHAKCVNLECDQVECDGGTATTVTGKVYDPSGTTPLYNAIVYVPNAAVSPFTPGVTCDACGAIASGAPLVSTLTAADGSFTLTNVPAGANVPLVIQLGRWRRQVTIPSVAACTATSLDGATLTRLPRNQAEGDIPQIAIATGASDPFECLLLKMGIDAAEFTPMTGKGRVHFFRENGTDLSPAAPAAKKLWSDPTTLMKYDLVILPCEGSAKNTDDPADHSGAALSNLRDYANAGGRVFTTHYSYAWTQAIWPTTGTWKLDQTYLNDVATTLDTSFPKGKAFADWLGNVSAPPAKYGELDIVDGRHDLDAVSPRVSQGWVSVSPSPSGDRTSVQHMTFNTPLDTIKDDAGTALQCGRVVFSDFHVSANALDSKQKYFPKSCLGGPLTNQEKALEFMLFDLSSCIQKDDATPTPPAPTPVPR